MRQEVYTQDLDLDKVLKKVAIALIMLMGRN